MDMTPIIESFAKVFLYLIPLAIIAGILKSPWFKGFVGELLVNILLKLRLDKAKYHLLKNVTLPTSDGTTQIDHILVSQYGVFVIETKNMKGWIFGSKNQKQWTQKIYKHTSKFQNPLHQNYKHTKTLASYLDIPETNIFSVIVFIGGCEFKTVMPENVIYSGDLVSYINSKNEDILTEEQINLIISTVVAERFSPSLKTHRAHVAHVHNIIEQKELENTCPKCGNEMILRTVKKGPNAGSQFWGCSQFPKCRATQKST